MRRWTHFCPPTGAGGLGVTLGPVNPPPRQEVRDLASSPCGFEPVLMPVPLAYLPIVGGYRPARFSRRCETRFAADVFVIRDDVAADELAKGLEHGLGEGNRSFDLAGLV